MATVYGVNKTKLNDAIGSNVIGTGENNAGKNFILDSYEAAALPASDVIEVGGKLPQGAVISRIDLVFDDLGTGTTASVGDGNTANRYVNAVDTASAAAVAAFPSAAAIDAVGYRVGTNAGDDQLQITNLGGAATGTIKILIEYAL